MLEPLITQVADRFTLGHDETRQLYRLLVVHLNRLPGGLPELRDHAADLGMEAMLDSWLGSAPDEPIAPGQVDDLLGAEVIEDMGERLGLTGSAVSGALSDLLPAAVRALARGAVPTFAAQAPATSRYGEAIAAQEAAPSRSAPWVLLAAAAVALGAYWYFSRRQPARSAGRVDD